MKLKLLSFLILSALPTYAGTITGQFQGASGVPVKNATINFALNQAGLIVGTGAIVPNTASCWTDQNGNVVGAPNPLQLPIIATTTGSGTLPSGIYYVVETFLTASGQSAPSPEKQIQLTSTGSLVIQPPTSIPSGVTGMDIYIGTTSGGETLQGAQGTTSVYTQGTPLVTGAVPPTSNTAVCNIAFNDTIIPYTGYTVTLISSTGNAYPGFPQSWQLNGGPSGTVNVSQGAPLFNGVVIYPTPILSQPLNNGQQSISGPLSFGGYNVTNMGTVTAGSLNSVVNANLQTGTDIGAKVNTSLSVCGSDCTIYVPAGQYSFSTPIVLPMNALGDYSLVLDDGAALSYTGSGCAITATINTTSPTVTNLRIRGGQLYGSASGQCGIHVYPSNSVSISGMLIYGFSAGQGIWLDGANATNIYDNRILNNQVGVYATPTFCSGSVCSPTTVGSGYTPNAIWIHHNVITGNSHWGVYFFDVVTGGLTGALNDVIDSNDIELNGSAGSTYGAVSVGRSSSLVIEANYLEGSPRQIVLGFPGSPGAYFGSYGAVIRDNHFTLLNTTPYEIELQDSTNVVIEGNSTLGSSIQNSGACFLNETQAVGTYFGKNHVITTASGSTGTVSVLCQAGTSEQFLAGAGSFSLRNTNYYPLLTYQNYSISAAASDTVSAQFVLPGDACYATASGTNSTTTASAQAVIAQVYVLPGTGQFTIYHPTGDAGFLYNVWCSGIPN